MEQLQQEGKAKSIGVSNFRVSDLKTVLDVCKVKPAINQIEYHPSIAAAAEPLIAFHKEQSIAVAMYGNLVSLSFLPLPSHYSLISPYLTEITTLSSPPFTPYFRSLCLASLLSLPSFFSPSSPTQVALRKPELQHVKTVAEEIAKERNITSGQVLQLWSRAKTGGEIVT
jgi:diketogulonate reductase-like aldo/keto reductase